MKKPSLVDHSKYSKPSGGCRGVWNGNICIWNTDVIELLASFYKACGIQGSYEFHLTITSPTLNVVLTFDVCVRPCGKLFLQLLAHSRKYEMTFYACLIVGSVVLGAIARKVIILAAGLLTDCETRPKKGKQ
jgi:hypothetical protein